MDLRFHIMALDERELDLKWVRSTEQSGYYHLLVNGLGQNYFGLVTKNTAGGYFLMSGETTKTLKEAKELAFQNTLATAFTEFEQLQSLHEVTGNVAGAFITNTSLRIIEAATKNAIGEYIESKIGSLKKAGYVSLSKDRRMGNSAFALQSKNKMFHFFGLHMNRTYLNVHSCNLSQKPITMSASCDEWNPNGRYWETSETFGNSFANKIEIDGLMPEDLMKACDTLLERAFTEAAQLGNAAA